MCIRDRYGECGTLPPCAAPAAMAVESSSISVVCRFRPQNSLEDSMGGVPCVRVDEDGKSITVGQDSYSNFSCTYDRVFDIGSSQAEVFEYAAKPVVQEVMRGYNGTVLAYGQTSCGKTYTMEGPSIDDEQQKGIIPRMVNVIFDAVMDADDAIEFSIAVSYVEIYMEKIRDLLDADRSNLTIQMDKSSGGTYIDASELYVSSPEDVMHCMRRGSSNRTTQATRMNEESSRSHSIFIVTVLQKNRRTGSELRGKLYLVDLAGSEKVSKTHAEGVAMEEAKQINKSLSCLGQVINHLTDGKSTHIPYRDSKLTRLLQESLGGNSKTCLMLNCSVSSYNEDETLSTLRFGQRAKKIKNAAKVNLEYSAEELRRMMEEMAKELGLERAKVADLEAGGGSTGEAGGGHQQGVQELSLIHI
eukprot:TRINITY_DN3473_c0_g1_i1.p1 TRINITY_DN3473_c0_g1~~TRINITY_DN3473_c0_g1_i1.p1  ORF type:complete len:416 (+),score=112.36 TRINITY_DN3473_c0_g1_i1:115-1362(+)